MLENVRRGERGGYSNSARQAYAAGLPIGDLPRRRVDLLG